jgi:transposase-like protein
MSKQRRRYTSAFKAKVALESLKSQQMVQELVSHYDLHPNQIINWKKELGERASEIFSHTKSSAVTEVHSSRDLYEQIDRLQVEK